MYSFRLNKGLMDNAKIIAEKMGISLSFFISCLIKEKISNLNSENKDIDFFTSSSGNAEILCEIASEIKNLRFDLINLLKNKR